MTEPSQYFKGRTVQEQMNEVIGYVDVRSAEVATDAIAADVAQVHQDMLDADADAQAAAASAAAAAGTLANAVKKTGEASQSIAGDIAVAGDLSGGTVTVPDPVNNTDAASKKYVDDADALLVPISGINSYAVGLTDTQDFNGAKRALQPFASWRKVYRVGGSASNTTSWFKVCDFVPASARVFILEHFTYGNYAEWGEIRFTAGGAAFTSHKTGNAPAFKVTLDVNNVYSLWVNPGHTYTYTTVTTKIQTDYGANTSNPFNNVTFDTSMTAHAEPVVGPEFTQVYDGVLIA